MKDGCCEAPGGSYSPMGELKQEGMKTKDMPNFQVEGSVSVPQTPTDRPKTVKES